MGNGLSPAVQKLLEERKILRVRRDSALIAKEIAAAKADLKKSKRATIQGYYAMFHSARALLYEKGFREKSHHALLVAVRELYVSEIERSLIQEFEHGMYLRQEADYGLKFSGRGAQDVIDIAEKMLERTKSILKLK